jgi:leader peptidase (prepilin peptidase)/N-methyltransferase
MGFGDVTLMAMIGSFIGWQATLIVFFLAPFAGLVVGLLQWILKRDNVVPYGPFLCFATAVLLIFWPSFWGYLGPFFLALGGSLPLVLLACLAMMAVLLVLLQRVKAVLFKLP